MTKVPPTVPILDAATRWSRPVDRTEGPLLVVMHGFGANEADLLPLAEHLPERVTVAAVRAPFPVPQLGPAAFGWFPLGERPGTPEAAYVDAAARGMLAWLDDVQARVRVPGPVALLGFSQGGAMAIQMLRHAPEAFAGAVVLSGFSTPGLVAGDEALAQIRPPLFWGRGLTDPVVGNDAVERTAAFLPAHTTLTERVYEGIGHGIGPAEMRDVAAFVEATL